MKWNGGDVRLELVMDDLHDRRVEGHAHPQNKVHRYPISFNILPRSLTASVPPLQDDLGR